MPRPVAADTLSEYQLRQAERFLQSRINAHLHALRPRLFRLQPMEAMAILGTLTLEAFARLPPEERTYAAAAWSDAIADGVRESLG